jgi:hypothetical protein
MTTKDAREGILASLRTVMGSNWTLPDPELDVSGCMLASMELGIKSVSWDMVKAELHKDPHFKDLADWIAGECQGPPENLPVHIKQYWRVRDRLRLVESVPGGQDDSASQHEKSGTGDAALSSPGGPKHGPESRAGSLLARVLVRHRVYQSKMFNLQQNSSVTSQSTSS